MLNVLVREGGPVSDNYLKYRSFKFRCVDFIQGNVKIYLYFLSFLDCVIALAVEIIPRWRPCKDFTVNNYGF